MAFALRNVGARCYALILREEHIGAVFSSDDDHPAPWMAVLHDCWAARKVELPSPFQAKVHRFESLQELRDWLGLARGCAAAVETG
jgi:hypothetical protein